MMFSFIMERIAENNLDIIIRHNFMVSGHSHMEVDSVHGAIERAKRETLMDIETPRDWAVFISQVRRKIPIEVIELHQNQFVALKQLNVRYTKPKFNCDGNTWVFRTITSFEYRAKSLGIVFYKEDVHDDTMKKFEVAKPGELSKNDLPILSDYPIQTEPIKLPQAKLNDLRDLLPFISNKRYYETLLKSLVTPKRKLRSLERPISKSEPLQ